MRITICLLLASCFSCSLLPWEDKEEVKAEKSTTPEQVPSKKIAQPTALDALELKYARLWARLDELEEEMSNQKELIELLERAQRTGILPSRIAKKDEKSAKKKSAKKEVDDEADFVAAEKEISEEATKRKEDRKKVEAENPVFADGGKIADNTEERLRRLAIVQDLFRQGSYGRSMAEVNSVIKELGDTSDGQGALWVARNWLALKEYQLASESFQKFVKQFPTSTYLPRARLDMARSDAQRGLRNKANQELQALIKEFPNSEVSEIAALEIERMQRSL